MFGNDVQEPLTVTSRISAKSFLIKMSYTIPSYLRGVFTTDSFMLSLACLRFRSHFSRVPSHSTIMKEIWAYGYLAQEASLSAAVVFGNSMFGNRSKSCYHLVFL
jgi:hypothetical protein